MDGVFPETRRSVCDRASPGPAFLENPAYLNGARAYPLHWLSVVPACVELLAGQGTGRKKERDFTTGLRPAHDHQRVCPAGRNRPPLADLLVLDPHGDILFMDRRNKRAYYHPSDHKPEPPNPGVGRKTYSDTRLSTSKSVCLLQRKIRIPHMMFHGEKAIDPSPSLQVRDCSE